VRHSKVTFELAENGLLHGFAGYFDCVLYKDLELSIHPERHSTGMFSWFPIFFPLKVSDRPLKKVNARDCHTDFIIIIVLDKGANLFPKGHMY
jgi:hypothetical protein